MFSQGVSDPHLKIEVSGSTYSVFVNGAGTPATTLTTSAFGFGQVALYDNGVQTFDNVNVLVEAASVSSPGTLLLLAIGLLGIGMASRPVRGLPRRFPVF